MATKTAATQNPKTANPTPTTPGGRSIGRQANINFNEGRDAGSFTVNEQRGQAENTIQGTIQKTEQEGIERGRSQENTAVDVLPPISPKQEVGQTETFSSKDGTDTADAIDALLKIRDKQTESTNPNPRTTPLIPTAPSLIRGQQPTAPNSFRTTFKNVPKKTLDPSQKSLPQKTPTISQAPNKLARRTGEVLMYTSPGGFIRGNIAPRIKERSFAKKSVKELIHAWNTAIIKKAETRGHDRFNLKTLEGFNQKETKKNIVGPTPPLSLHNIAEDKARAPQSGEKGETPQSERELNRLFSPQWEPQEDTTPSNEYSSWSSPQTKQRLFNKPRSPLSSWNQRPGTGHATQGITKNIGKKAGQKVAQQAATEVAEAGTKVLIFNPAVLTGIGVALFAIFFIVTVIIIILSISGKGGNSTGSTSNGGGSNPGTGSVPPATNPIPGFELRIDADKTQASVGDKITYTITYSYAPPSGSSVALGDITIYDALPSTVNFQDASGTKTYDTASNTVSWKLSDPGNTGPFTLTVTVNSDNVRIVNSAYATTSGAVGATTVANSNNCNGTYPLDNPIGNFGDPTCYFANNKAQAMSDLYDMLKTQDPTNADGWYYKVASCETGGTYSPNAYRPQHVDGADDTPDPNGAWGLFQMSMNNYNGAYDLGATVWQNQVENAVNYGKRVASGGQPLGAYWFCWR